MPISQRVPSRSPAGDRGAGVDPHVEPLRSGTAVKFVISEGGGHTWFTKGLGPANGVVDATRLIWDFFSSFAKRSDEDP